MIFQDGLSVAIPILNLLKTQTPPNLPLSGEEQRHLP